MPWDMGQRIVYLDFDGVLHSDEVYWHRKRGIELRGPGRLFEHAPLLQDLLAPWPEVRLVLSTSWVPSLSFSRARSFLPAALQARVVGATWHSHFRRDWEWRQWWLDASRFDTVMADVLRRRPLAWLAIDDDVAAWEPTYADHLVTTQSPTGLSDPAVQQRLAERLVALHEPGALPMPTPFAERLLPRARSTPTF
jgi:hypothetical protein